MVGQATVSLKDLNKTQGIERWYPLVTGDSTAQARILVSISFITAKNQVRGSACFALLALAIYPILHIFFPLSFFSV